MKSLSILLLVTFVFAACTCQSVNTYIGKGTVAYFPQYQPSWGTNGGNNNAAFVTSNDGRVEVKFDGVNQLKTIEFCATEGGYPPAFNLQQNCPDGQYGKLVNDSATDIVLSRKSLSAFNENRAAARFIGSTRFAAVAEAEDVATVTLFLKPTTTYFFTFAHLDDDDQYGQMNINIGPAANACPVGQSWSKATEGCEIVVAPAVVATTAAATEANIAVAKDAWVFKSFTPNVAAGQLRIFYYNVTIKATSNIKKDFDIYMRAGAFPSPGQSADIDISYEDDDQTAMFSINAPTMLNTAGAQSASVFYLGFMNSNSDAVTLNMTVEGFNCAGTTMGIMCADDSSKIMPLTNTSQHAGKTSSSSDVQYFHLMLNSTFLPNAARAVRVSVANKDQAKNAPALYAFQGYSNYPTAHYSSFNSSSQSGVSQLILFLSGAVALPQRHQFTIGVGGLKGSFKIWAGDNCPSNCTGRGHCMCSGQICNVTNLYQYPEFEDSFGSCNCTKSKYDGSYDCTSTDLNQSSTPFSTIYIVLIAVGGAIVLAVAIGVPVYCYLQNRKRANYQRV